MIIKNGRIMDPKSGMDEIKDILIKNNEIIDIGKFEFDDEIIDAEGLIVAPGFVDVHVHFRDPGFIYKEDIYTGAKSAATGGFTSVICMANTEPKIDNIEILDDLLNRVKDSIIKIYSISALTKNFDGENLVDMEKMIEHGAVGFSDDGIPDKNSKMVLEAMQRAKKLDVPISFHEEDPSLIQTNGINKGEVSEKLGLGGSPTIAEDVLVARDVVMAIYTKAKIDIQHISSGLSVELIRWGKKMGANIYAEITPHHFTLNENAVLKYKSLAKMNPPLRTEKDRQAILEGIKDGTLSIIATDHAPHSFEDKDTKLEKAPSGIIGLETALGLGIRELVNTKTISLMELLRYMTINPAKLYKLEAGFIEKKGPADLVIFNPEEKFKVGNFQSKSNNSPFIDEEIPGKIHYTICKGKVVYKNI